MIVQGFIRALGTFCTNVPKDEYPQRLTVMASSLTKDLIYNNLSQFIVIKSDVT